MSTRGRFARWTEVNRWRIRRGVIATAIIATASTVPAASIPGPPLPRKAAHCGLFGLEVVLDGTTPAYVQDNKPQGESRYVVQFYFNASPVSLASGSLEIFTAFYGLEGSGSPAFQVYLEPTATAGKVASISVDGVGFGLSSSVDIDPGWHAIQVDWQIGNGDGSILVTLNGSTIVDETSLSNSDTEIEYVRMGALSGIGASLGSVFFDDFDSRRIGPIDAKICTAGSGAQDTPGIYRDSDRQWYLKNSNSGGYSDIEIPYGDPSDIAVVGDWDGDGIDTVGIYRNNSFFLRNTNTAGNADIVVGFGGAGDIPVAGDWDGDGTDTIGVYRPSTGAWFLRNTNTAGSPDLAFTYGLTNETPVTGDWDGDGVDTVGIFRASDRSWYLRNSNSPGASDINAIPYGDPATDIPITGDWNGDGVDTFGVYRPASGTWFLRNSNTPGNADLSFTYGILNEKPVVGDWDGQ